MESLQKPLRGTRLFSDGYVCIINPRDQQVATSGLARQRKIEAGLPAFFARRNILEYEGLRAKIDFSKPQQAICHLLNSRVNNPKWVWRNTQHLPFFIPIGPLLH